MYLWRKATKLLGTFNTPLEMPIILAVAAGGSVLPFNTPLEMPSAARLDAPHIAWIGFQYSIRDAPPPLCGETQR